MATLMKLIKAVVGAAILDWILKVALGPAIVAYLTGSRKGGMLPRYLQILLEGAAALKVLRSMKGRGIMQPSMLSIIGALLAALVKSKQGSHDGVDRIIETEEYTIVDER